MTLPTEDVVALVAYLQNVLTDWNGADIPDAELPRVDVLCGTLRLAATALSTLAGERDEALELIESIRGTEGEFREAVERAGMVGSTYIVHALDEWVARAEAAEARATTAEAQVVAMRGVERRFEQIRTILVNHLDEPERAAFWIAVEGRDAARTALLAGTPPSGAETQEKVDG